MTVTGAAITAEAPVLVASYDENGRFIGLVAVTTPAVPVEPAEDAETIKIFWVDEALAPKAEDEEIHKDDAP